MSEKKILLVDDETFILDTYASLLDKTGYAVITAYSGKKALEIFTHHSFDLVITDLAMDDGDGFYLIDGIRNKYPHTPVMVFTGKASDGDKQFVSLMGVKKLIEKPCSNEQFIMSVKNSLQ